MTPRGAQGEASAVVFADWSCREGDCGHRFDPREAIEISFPNEHQLSISYRCPKCESAFCYPVDEDDWGDLAGEVGP